MTELPEQIRAFVALKIPSEIVCELHKIQQRLKPELNDVSWTRPDAMHLTLHFFGDVASAQLGAIEGILGDAAAASCAFALEVRGVGSFGSRVIWAGLAGETEKLAALAADVRQRVSPFGSHEEERAFKGHATLGRLRRPAGGLSRKLRAYADHGFGSWTVNHLELIRSELSPHGSRYTTLGTFPLVKR